MYHKDRAKVQQKNELCKQFSQKVYFLSNFLASSPSRLIASSPFLFVHSPRLITSSPNRLIASSPHRPLASPRSPVSRLACPESKKL